MKPVAALDRIHRIFFWLKDAIGNTPAMDTIEIRPWTLLVDRKATSEAYVRIKACGSDSCGCNTCRNWRAARAEHLPRALRALLDSLGVDAAKDVEVYELRSDDEGGVEYGGWFAFVGRVVGGPDAGKAPDGTPGKPTVVQIHCEDIGDGVAVSFASGCDLLPEAFEGSEVASVSFSLTLPWVASKKKLP